MDLTENELHLWFAELEDFPLPELEAHCLRWLSEQERARYKRYRLEQSRHELLLGQMLTRLTLTEYLQKPPEEWEFTLVANGKPVLSDSNKVEPVHFNLTHSNGRVVLAVGKHEPIGVDLEKVKAKRRIRNIAERHFSPREVEQLLMLDSDAQLSRFYELWTLKESYIKATGEGLKLPLDSFGFDLIDRTVMFWLQSGEEVEEKNWCFWQLNAGDDYRLAVGCSPGRGSQLSSIKSFRRSGLEKFHESALEILRCS